MKLNLEEKTKEIYDFRLGELLNEINNSKTPIDKAKKLLRKLAEEITAFDGKLGASSILNEIEDIHNDDKKLSYDEAIEIFCREHKRKVIDIVNILATNKALNDLYKEIHKMTLPIIINSEEEEKEYDKNPNFTLSRQVLAIKYLLEEVYEKSGLSMRNCYDTDLARFVQFLTGREPLITEIKDTRIIRKWRKPLNTTDKEAEKDLNFVAEKFKSLGLNIIVGKIEKEINSRENQ